MRKMIIKNGKVWDGYTFSCKDICWEYDKIVKMEENLELDADYVYDAKGKIVSAGLVDVHAHMKGITEESYSIHADMSCLPFGVTAANDANGTLGDRDVLDSFMVKNTVFCTVEIKDNHAVFEHAERQLEQYGDKAIGLKVYFDTRVSHVRDITALKETCEYAHERNLKVMVHCSNSPCSMMEIVQTLNCGDILSHAFHGGVHAASEDHYECFKLAKERGVILDSGFSGFTHVDYDVFEGAVREGVIPDTISTDITRRSAYKRGGRYGLPMCMSMARVMGMKEKDIFRSVTSNAAKALGKEGEWGCLKVGGKADIAVLEWTDDGFSLTDKAGHVLESNEGYRCVMTVADGEVIYTV